MGYMRDKLGKRLDSIRVAQQRRVRPSLDDLLWGFVLKAQSRATTQVPVFVIGDSVVDGVGVTDNWLRWIERMTVSLRAKLPVQGLTGTSVALAGMPGGGIGWQKARGAITYGASWPVASAGTTQGSNGIGHCSVILSGAGSTWTTPLRGYQTSIGLLLKRTATDAMTIAIDGTTVATLAAGATPGYQLWTSAALTRGRHTLVVTQTAGTPEVCNFAFFDGDESAGIQLVDCGKSGAKAVDYTASSEWLNAAIAANITPALVIIEPLLNDATAVDAATYRTNMQSLITKVRGQWANVPILLLGMYRRAGVNTVDAGGWDAYYAALRSLADATPYTALLDIDDRTPDLTTDIFGFRADATHPSTIGHDWIGRLVADTLVPGPADSQLAISAEITLAGPTFVPGPVNSFAYALAATATGLVDWAYTRAVSGVQTRRWMWRMTNDTEAGSNVGSNLELHAYADNGTDQGAIMQLQRRGRIAQFYGNGVRLPQCTSTTRPATNYGNGAVLYETDTKRLIASDGTGGWTNVATGAAV